MAQFTVIAYEKEKYFFISIIAIILTLIIAGSYAKFYSINSLNNSIRSYSFQLQGTNPKGQIQYISTHIKETILLFTTLIYEVPKLLLKMFDLTYKVFNVDYGKGLILSYFYYIYFGFICLFYPLNIKIKNFDRLRLFLITLMIIVSTYFIQLLTWSGVGNFESGVDWGVHLRYFIPLFALMPLIFNLNMNNIKKEKIENYLFIFLIGFMASIPLYITTLFY